jgi:hypothetical protein
MGEKRGERRAKVHGCYTGWDSIVISAHFDASGAPKWRPIELPR